MPGLYPLKWVNDPTEPDQVERLASTVAKARLIESVMASRFLVLSTAPPSNAAAHSLNSSSLQHKKNSGQVAVKRATLQLKKEMVGACVPQELDGGETGVAVEDGGEGEAVEEGLGAEDDLVLHLLAGSLQLGAAPPDGLQLRRRGGARRHASRRRHLASRSGGSNPAAAPEGAGGVGGERQPRNTRAQQRHTSGVIFLFSLSRYLFD